MRLTLIVSDDVARSQIGPKDVHPQPSFEGKVEPLYSKIQALAALATLIGLESTPVQLSTDLFNPSVKF